MIAQSGFMIKKSYTKASATSVATYSDCEKYRYSLIRIWKPNKRRLVFVMLNPSTATEILNDPTVERCERRARKLDYGSIQVINIFAWRATDPKKMRVSKDPIGPDNDITILEACDWCDDIIAAWGSHGAHLKRGIQVEKILRNSSKPIFHLGLSKQGHPKHPLYISYSKKPERWI